MNIQTPAAELGSRTARSWLFDVAVAGFALLASSAYVTSAQHVPTWVAALIIVALAAPLVVRRRWPVPVFAWQLLVAASAGWWAMQVVWSVALLIGLYTVVVLRPRRDGLIAAGVLALGVLASAAHVFPDNWLASAVPLLAVVVATTAFALYIRTRRVLMDELRDRAMRLERERDQQVALAAAAERTRIAREMHDIVAHHLTVMVTLSDGAAAQAGTAPERAAEAMRTVSATGRLALNDTRRLLGVLRDRAEDGAARTPLPDVAALDELIERVRTAGLPVRYDVEGRPPDDSPGLELAVYRIVQEALTNTMKHAGDGATATVRVRYRPDDVSVDVTDDGIGAVGDGTGAGRGLIGMSERVEAYGGQLRSGPRTPGGWAVSARIPARAELPS